MQTFTKSPPWPTFEGELVIERQVSRRRFCFSFSSRLGLDRFFPFPQYLMSKQKSLKAKINVKKSPFYPVGQFCIAVLLHNGWIKKFITKNHKRNTVRLKLRWPKRPGCWTDEPPIWLELGVRFKVFYIRADWREFVAALYLTGEKGKLNVTTAILLLPPKPVLQRKNVKWAIYVF